MEEKRENWFSKHKMGIFIGVSAVLMLIGLSYAWLQLTLRGTKELTILTAGSLELELDDTMAGGISFTEAVPVTNEEGLSQDGYTFTLENKGNVTSDYTIYLDDLDLAEGQTRMNDSFIKYQLTKDGNEVDLQLLDKTGTSPNRVLETGTIEPKTKYTYILKMWIDQDATNEVMETMFKGQLRIEAMQEVGTKLYNEIAKSAVLDNIQSEFVSASTGINFGEVSSDTNGKGVYTFASTKDDVYPVHYYRGAVTDNNVKFGGFCWKIVRTTETGGVKLIYNGSPDSEGKCMNTTGEVTQIGTSTFNNEFYDISADIDMTEYELIEKEKIGYMLNNTEDSAIKGVIDTWYQMNMTSYTSKLEDTIWCNDRNIVKIDHYDDGDITYFGINERAGKPNLGCVNNTDKFTVRGANGNGLLTHPVALLTADEIMLAGGMDLSQEDKAVNYYLNTNQDWWTLTPDDVNFNLTFGNYGPHVIFVSSNGLFSSYPYFVYSSFGVRPAISLAPRTKITSGDGSQSSPFVVGD